MRDWAVDSLQYEMVAGMMDSLQSCRIFLVMDSFIGIAPEAALESGILCIIKG
jgi:hypothetical protein